MLPLLGPLAVVAVDRPILEYTLPTTEKRPTLVWANREFRSKGELEDFLRSRGVDYETWAARHPGAAPWPTGARDRDVVAAFLVGCGLMFGILFGFSRGRRDAGP